MIVKVIILIILFYLLYSIVCVDEKRNGTEGFGNVDGNANFVVYGGQKQNANVRKAVGDKTVMGKSYDLQGNFDYEQTVLNQNKDLTYYYNDVLDQSKINETSYDIDHGIDVIDYSGNFLTGEEKCRRSCSGECTTFGYDSNSVCFPKSDYEKGFDLGTLFKSPAFTLGISDNN